MTEVKLRRNLKHGKEILTVYLDCQPELRKVERELKRLGYLQEEDEILCYWRTDGRVHKKLQRGGVG